MRAAELELTRFFLLFHQDGWTALMTAAEHGHTATAAELARLGADMNVMNNVRICCSCSCCARGAQHIFGAADWLHCTHARRALWRYRRGRRARSPGRECERAGHGKGPARAARRAPCADTAEQDGETALTCSAMNGHTAVVTELVRCGANMDASSIVRSPLLQKQCLVQTRARCRMAALRFCMPCASDIPPRSPSSCDSGRT